VYTDLGITITYHQDRRVHVEARSRVVDDGVGGPTLDPTTRAIGNEHGASAALERRFVAA